jgi:DNA-3-methyladenine glycosylase I
VHITCYSGFRAATVEAKLDTIDKWFPDYETVSQYGPDQIDRISADPQMIGNERKLKACIDNAKSFAAVVERNGSFQAYLDSFQPRTSFANLLRLRSDLMSRFAFLGRVTSLHFLMELAFPVLKPDRVVTRIFHRLGFLADESFDEESLHQAIRVGQKFAEATGHPIRYVDIVFVAYGQVRADSSLQQGICLKDNPRCTICGVRSYCTYRREPHQEDQIVKAERHMVAELDDGFGPNPMQRPTEWKEKGGPCPICRWPETRARRSRTTGELYFGCARPKRGPRGGCPFKGCRSH